MEFRPFVVTDQTLENALGNIYGAARLADQKQWEQFRALTKFAKQRHVELSPNELNHAKQNWYNMLFDHTFRTLQKILRDGKMSSLLNKGIAFTGVKSKNGFSWKIPRANRSEYVSELLATYLRFHPRATPPLLDHFYRLKLLFVPSDIETDRAFAFYLKQEANLKRFYPAILENVIHIWLSSG